MKQLYLTKDDLAYLNEAQRTSFDEIVNTWWKVVKELFIVSFLVGGIVPNFVILFLVDAFDTNMPHPIPAILYGTCWFGITGTMFTIGITIFMLLQKRKISHNLVNSDESFVTYV